MRDTLNCIKKYAEVVNDEKFILHWKQLSEKLLDGIQKGYKNGLNKLLYEPDVVKNIEDIINSIGQFSTKSSRFNIFTNSVFIHGNKSQVEFKYYGKSTRRELGDIIFILSVFYKGKKYFEKMTINQVKKSKNTSWNFNNNSTREQLYLLSRFPTFRGAKGSLVSMKDYNLSNDSGCFGTHGLIYYPGDFALISSKQLEVILSGENSLKLDHLSKVYTSNSICPYFSCCYLLDNIGFYECLYILDELLHFYHHWHFRWPFLACNLPILGNKCIAHNAYEFSNNYLSGYIGELIYAKKIPYNIYAFQFLQDLLHAIRKKAKREDLKYILKFMSSFYSDGYDNEELEGHGEIDYEGGGLGIIHTTINLREGE